MCFVSKEFLTKILCDIEEISQSNQSKFNVTQSIKVKISSPLSLAQSSIRWQANNAMKVAIRGGSRPKLKGGQLGEGVPKTQWKVSAPKARENFWGFIRENPLVFLLNNALVYMFLRIQNESLKKECIRALFLLKRGRQRWISIVKGGSCPHLPP